MGLFFGAHMTNIPLHPKRGLDTHLTYCPRCGGDSNSLIIGRTTVAHVPDKPHKIITCWTFGKGKEIQAELRRKNIDFNTREANEGERLPGDLCKKCEEELTLHRSIVEEGGVYFRCKECGCNGVIKGDSELAKEVRQSSGIEAPNPVGFEFDNCSQHGKLK